MVTRDTAWADGTPCWVDVGVDDIPKACAFYAGLFGWEAEQGPPEAGGYAICRKNGHTVAGIGPKQGPAEMPPVWTTYLASSDVGETARKIREAGGQILVEPMDVMDAGRLVIAADPATAVFGVWQAGQHIGAKIANEPGSMTWNENLSRDFEGNKSFYRAVFGYEYGDMSDAGFHYATLRLAGSEVGGIGELDDSSAADVPAQWNAYFAVDDTDAAIATVNAAGGSLVRPPWDTPYGRMAAVRDDQGAVFSLVGVTPASS